jgi:hypothetical protein
MISNRLGRRLHGLWRHHWQASALLVPSRALRSACRVLGGAQFCPDLCLLHDGPNRADGEVYSVYRADHSDEDRSYRGDRRGERVCE